MYAYCEESSSSWATIQDLYDRFGEEYVDKLAVRRNWDAELKMYVADETEAGKFKVLCLALQDAKNLLIRKLQCQYTDIAALSTSVFPAIKQLHIQLTIETLKNGGDCSSCACNTDIDKYIDCGTICNDAGECLVSNKSFISASEAHFHCECKGHCGCCK